MRMRYINLRFTYLLTFFVTYIGLDCAVFYVPTNTI